MTLFRSFWTRSSRKWGSFFKEIRRKQCRLICWCVTSSWILLTFRMTYDLCIRITSIALGLGYSLFLAVIIYMIPLITAVSGKIGLCSIGIGIGCVVICFGRISSDKVFVDQMFKIYQNRSFVCKMTYIFGFNDLKYSRKDTSRSKILQSGSTGLSRSLIVDTPKCGAS